MNRSLPEDGDLSPKNVGEFIYIYIYIYILCAFVGDCVCVIIVTMQETNNIKNASSIFRLYRHFIMCRFFCVSYSLLHHYHCHHHHHHHHYHLGNMELRHLRTRSGLTHPEVSLMFSPNFFCPFVCIFYYSR